MVLVDQGTKKWEDEFIFYFIYQAQSQLNTLNMFFVKHFNSPHLFSHPLLVCCSDSQQCEPPLVEEPAPDTVSVGHNSEDGVYFHSVHFKKPYSALHYLQFFFPL